MTTTSILTTLGTGSGIDTPKLIADLTAATREPKQRVLYNRTALNSARLSANAQLSDGITALATSSVQRLRSLADADIPSFVEDLVASINAVHQQLTSATAIGAGTQAAGPLAGDAGARTLARGLSALAGSQVMSPPTTCARLSDIGISTGRDGSLSLDSGKLAAAIANDLPAVKALLGVGSPVASGFAKVLVSLRDTMTGQGGVLALSKLTYQRVSRTIATDQSKLDTAIATMTDRLTASFSAMDREVAKIKASQAYLTQQVAIWTKSA